MVLLGTQTTKVHIVEPISELKRGSERAFETIFRTHYVALCTYANSMLQDTVEAEEVVQASFLALWEAKQELDIHTSLKAYLYRMVHNRCLNKIKHVKIMEVHADEVRYLSNDSLNYTDEEIIGSELKHRIAAAIELLPSQCKVVFKLSRNEGLTYAEIAQKLGVSTKAVDKQIVRALRILREELKDYIPAILLILLLKL